MKRIVIFASGSGTNAENIIKYFGAYSNITVTQVLCNKPNAKVFKRCIPLKTNCLYFDKSDLTTNGKVLDILKKQADFIVLAGFLWRIPESIIDIFPNKIINIHPSLLPKYGGKGMYGMHVHRAVKANNEAQSGITIHYVNEQYDQGDIIYQAKINITDTDTTQDIAVKIHKLEYKYFPEIIHKVILKS